MLAVNVWTVMLEQCMLHSYVYTSCAQLNFVQFYQHRNLLYLLSRCEITAVSSITVYIVRHKKHTKFFYHNLKKGYPILIIFGTHLYDTTSHQIDIYFPTSPNICFCITWQKQNRQNMH